MKNKEQAAKKAKLWGRLHLVMAGIWLLLFIPTVLIWSESILWVLFVSLYANFVTHVSAWQATRAERVSAENP